MEVPSDIVKLVERFDRNRTAYRSDQYNEAKLRVEFLNPFFEALGWDVTNREGNAEAYKDVINEDAIKVGGVTKAPDYCFRIGGTRKFFVEAKKPIVNLKDMSEPAFQLRRYAWSAKLPLSILTDFEEFAVYDCRVKPDRNDKASIARIKYLTYTEYIQHWNEITSIFSKNAILKGSFDAYAETNKGKRGTAEVDAAFLEEIEAWRQMLASNIALRNREIKQRELNFAVQMTIDRIIFLRICEDRGIEVYERLKDITKGAGVYERLCDLFRQADERYNSGLFHFQKEKGRSELPDDLTLHLVIDDKLLKEIIKKLYYPDSPYEFSVLSVSVLGQVYEQFLGKVINLSSSHRVTIEEKPEVRKSGGVYYTPDYIVEYIVHRTLGKFLEGKKLGSTGNVSKLKLVDPACGSGSFLIASYQYLLNWHRDKYIESGPQKHKKELYQGAAQQWFLTTQEKKRILLNNIYGVDIDPQAVEVTKLSLLLKVLEDESEQTLVSQLRMFHERALPDLDNNIKCGNSLIGPDFLSKAQQLDLFSDEQQFRINVFDWQREFKEVFQQGGFDVFIGNPPWISLSGKFGTDIYTKHEILYLIERYNGNTYMPNMYEYFVTQGLNLTRRDGYFGFIVPDRLGYNDQFIGLRLRILEETSIQSLLYKMPFPGIVADTLIFLFKKTEPDKNMVTISAFGKTETIRTQASFKENPSYTFEYFDSPEIMKLVIKLRTLPTAVPISSVCDTTSGFGGKSTLIFEKQTSPEQIEVIKGDSIGRYELKRSYWFEFNRKNITGRTTDKEKLGASSKILIRKTGDHIIATLDYSGIFPEQSLYFIFNNRSEMDLSYFLGLLNSKLINYFYRASSLTNKMSIAQVKKGQLDQIPVPILNLNDTDEKLIHDKLVAYVKRMLELHRQLVTVKSIYERNVLQRQIVEIDEEIDQIVYRLYSLSLEEIELVQEGVNPQVAK